jgi:4-amino-4-deoxy-L-arabinose transferase-like glycosyltransferase
MSSTTLFILLHYLFFIVLGLVCFIIGGRITVRCNYHSFIERVSISTTLGMGCLGMLIFFLGLVRGLYGRVLIPIIIVLLLAAIVTWPGLLSKLKAFDLRTKIKKIKGTTVVWLAIITIVILFTFKLPLYPPTAWDATEYHLAVAKIYTQAHAIVFTPYLRYPVTPQLNQMLFVGAFIAYDDISAQLIEYAMLILISFGLYSLSKRYFSPWVGIFSSALWLGSPLAIQNGTIGYIDIGLTLFAFFGIYAFINYHQTDENSWLWLSGIFLGFAAAVKYPALFLILVCGIISLWMAIKKRDFRILLKLGIAILAMIAPFYIRNYYYSGNPFFPYLSNIFHQRIWNVADAVGLAREQSWWGLSKTALNLVKLPLYLVFKPNIFMLGFDFKIILSPVYLLAFPSIPLMFFIRKTRLMSIFTASFTLFWFSTVQIIRYLLPVIPVLAILASIALDYLLRRIEGFLSGPNRSFSLSRILRPVIYTFLTLSFILPTIIYGRNSLRNLGALPVRSWERAEFLQLYLPSYPAYRALNAKFGDNYSIYALQDENMAYFAKGTFMGDWFGPARFSQLTDKLNDDVLLYKQLRQLKADYFLVNLARVGEIPKVLLTSPYFQVIEQNDAYIVFKLISSP